jgi:hypothetical protein
MSDKLVLHIYSTVKNHFLVYTRICTCHINAYCTKISKLYTQSHIEMDVLVLGMLKIKAFVLVH